MTHATLIQSAAAGGRKGRTPLMGPDTSLPGMLSSLEDVGWRISCRHPVLNYRADSQDRLLWETPI